MAEMAKPPEPQHGPWVTSFDPLTLQWTYAADYNVSYAQDSPFFIALGAGRLLGSRCPGCNYRYATPRAYCMNCGRRTQWLELPGKGRVHSWTICNFSGEPYLKECPFMLGLIEFEGIDTLFMTRLMGIGREEIRIGMAVEARYRRKKTWSVNDVYFVKAAE
jgi:uncharacterized protein